MTPAPNLGNISSTLEACCPTCYAKAGDFSEDGAWCPTCGDEYAVRRVADQGRSRDPLDEIEAGSDGERPA